MALPQLSMEPDGGSMRVGLSCAQFVIPLKGKCENEMFRSKKV